MFEPKWTTNAQKYKFLMFKSKNYFEEIPRSFLFVIVYSKNVHTDYLKLFD